MVWSLSNKYWEFCKILLNVNKITPGLMVYGELGGFSLNICIKLQAIEFFDRLISDKNEKYLLCYITFV